MSAPSETPSLSAEDLKLIRDGRVYDHADVLRLCDQLAAARSAQERAERELAAKCEAHERERQAWMNAHLEKGVELAAVREALEFYANPDIYKPHPHGLAFDNRDLSFCAIRALGGQHG